MAAKMKEADERIRKAEENASQLEKKFMDMVKQVHGSTGMQQLLNLKFEMRLTPIVASNREQMNVDVASNKDAWQSWRSEEDKAGSVNLGMGESDVEENSVTEILNENMVPARPEDEGERGMRKSDKAHK